MNSGLIPELGHLLARLDSEVVFSQEITQLTSPEQRKASFRISLQDGRVVKARQFVSDQKRIRYCDLLSLLEGLPFSRVIAAEGRATLEEWIGGTPLQPAAVTDKQAFTIGNLLGILHTEVTAPEIYPENYCGPNEHLEKISESLSFIAAHEPDKLSLCRDLEKLAIEHKPSVCESGLIHADYCPQNMVLNSDGTIVVIDNEHIRTGALDYDLARCWGRWPMTPLQGQAFYAGYSRHRELDMFRAHIAFWAIRALSLSAKVHIGHGNPNKGVEKALFRIITDPPKITWHFR